jgi:polyhydroxyalkanoate synthesis regulator phasin
MINTIILVALIIILVINFVLDINSRKSDRVYDSKVQQRINILTDRVNKLSVGSAGPGAKEIQGKFDELEQSIIRNISLTQQQLGFRLENLSKDLDITMRTLDSVQEKISELEVSIQNLSNQK